MYSHSSINFRTVVDSSALCRNVEVVAAVVGAGSVAVVGAGDVVVVVAGKMRYKQERFELFVGD